MLLFLTCYVFQVSGIQDIDEMVKKFIKIDDENFALFNFVKEQSQQVQQKEAAVENLKQQIEKIQIEDVRVEKQQKEIIGQLEITEKRQRENHQKLVAQIKNEEKLLEKVCTKINEMLERAKCSRSSMLELLAGSKISTHNIVSYLGLIEQRAAELVQAKTLLQLRKGEEQQTPEMQENQLTFATVGKIARYLIGLPSLISDLPECNTPLMEFVRPISQKEAREIATNMNKIDKIDLSLIPSKADVSSPAKKGSTQE